MSADPGQDPVVADVHLDLPDRREGKVRVSYALSDERRLFITTDRLSAFDRIVALIPWKGQVLNQLSAWWFETTRDVVDNHLLEVPDSRAMIVRAATPLPVEVVVRRAMTGSTSTSLWQQYSAGARRIYGYEFPEGLTKNSLLPELLLTPTTKAPAGGHDEPLSSAEVVDRGLVDVALWKRVTDAALALFTRGEEVAAEAGLILADTKYEFGVDADQRLLLIDEVHTPDSSRYWVRDTYLERLEAGDEPESLDKEPVRLALTALGYRGEGPVPDLGSEVIAATSRRYVDAYERLTRRSFTPDGREVERRLARVLNSSGGPR